MRRASLLDISACVLISVIFLREIMKSKVKVFPHNDLFNLAHYHREQMNKKLESGGRDGISLDCMSCLIALAFTVEALVNLVGHKRIDKWKERDGYLKKSEQ